MIVSYVTEEYRKKGERLADCLSGYDVPFFVKFMDSFGTHKDHKIYKPFFLEEMLNKYPDEPSITLVDGDSFFMKKPLSIEIKNDMGLVRGKQHENHQYWFSDAFHIHRPTQGTKDFVRIWKRLCEERN